MTKGFLFMGDFEMTDLSAIEAHSVLQAQPDICHMVLNYIAAEFTHSNKTHLMSKGRLEAFSDGVIAIIITIMVLELKVPHGDTLASLKPLLPVFASYVLSFVYVAIYWNNHHHLMHITQHVNGRVLWANVHLLFWLSIIPFVTGWMGENHFSTWPVALYGMVLIMTGTAYTILTMELKRLHGPNSTIAKAIGQDKKGKISVLLYVVGITVCFFNNWLGFACYVMVASIWFIPDRRIENLLNDKGNNEIERTSS